jgi:lysophospholipase L1-like esterase
MATLGLLVLLPYVVPGLGHVKALERMRLLSPLASGQGLVLAARPSDDAPRVGEIELQAPAPGQSERLALPENVTMPEQAEALLGSGAERKTSPRAIEDPSGHTLDSFFAALERVERHEPSAVGRICFWGDSNVAGDLVSGVLRRKMQARFGDAGHGFVLLAGPTEWDFANDVWRSASNAWSISRIPGPLAADGFYGLGGVSFRARGAAAYARVATAKAGTLGRKVSRFVVDYLEYPEGADLEVRIDGQSRETLPTRADEPKAVLRSYEVPDGEHELELRALGTGTRVFGVFLERDAPGVVVDALGVTSAKIRHLGRIEPRHFHEQLRWRNPALIVFNFGVNECREGERQFGLDDYERTTVEVLRDIRAALPDSSCLVISPNDIAWKTSKGDRLSNDMVPKLAAAQRKVAAEVGCAFWDMYEAMGGAGSMGRWISRQLGRPDMLHPTAAGAEVLGDWLFLALMDRYDAFKAQPK